MCRRLLTLSLLLPTACVAGISWTGKVTMLYGQGLSSGELVPTYVLWDIGQPTAQHVSQLGANTYRADLTERTSESGDDRLCADTWAFPTADAGPVAPEPATLLLAGVGRGGVGVLRPRRR
jgi:hypothetical protein